MAELKGSLKSKGPQTGNAKPSKKPNEEPQRSRGHATEARGRETQKTVTKADNPMPGPTESGTKFVCPLCHETGHGIPKCQKWKKGAVEERWNMARQNNICFRCLYVGHQGKSCKSNKKCNVEGCERTHHPSLHSDRRENQDSWKKLEPIVNRSNFGIGKDGRVVPTKVGLRILPVYLIDKGNHKRRLNVFLDDGSDSSYIRTETARAIGIVIENPIDLTVSTLVDQG
jgi:hypothetical protein